MDVVGNPVISRQVLSPEEFLAAVRCADFEACQLSPNPAPSLIARVMGPQTCLDVVEVGPAMLFSGVMPAGAYTLVFVTKCSEIGHSFNFSTVHTDGYMGFFPPRGQLDAHTPEGYANATLTMPVAVFHNALERVFPEIPDQLLKQGAAMRIGAPEQMRLRNLLATVMESIEDPAGPLSSLMARSEVECLLIDAFLAALRDGAGHLVQPPKCRMAGRLNHLRQAREFIRKSTHESIQLEDVGKALGMSPRGVEVLFHDCLGIGPNAFIRHQRLHGVRRALLEARPRLGAVKELALEWGFRHMGHFSVNYRALFGESPSATLRR